MTPTTFKLMRLSNEADGDCEIRDCENPGYPYSGESLNGYVCSCYEHARRLVQDALDEGLIRWNPEVGT